MAASAAASRSRPRTTSPGFARTRPYRTGYDRSARVRQGHAGSFRHQLPSNFRLSLAAKKYLAFGAKLAVSVVGIWFVVDRYRLLGRLPEMLDHDCLLYTSPSPRDS